jgi:hypothetical protein
MEFPMNGEMLNLINVTVKSAVSDAIAELKRQNLIVEGKQTPFQKTETLLYNYNNFKAAIKDKEEQIAELRQYGIRKKSAGISSFSGVSGFVEVKSDSEQVEEKIERIQLNIQTTKNYIKVIDDALDVLANDPYFEIIPKRYFKRESTEEIAQYLNCDMSTVKRNKNRLINLLQIRLFSDEVIQQIFMS